MQPFHRNFFSALSISLALAANAALGAEGVTQAELKNLSINGGVEDGNARLVIEAKLKGMPDDASKVIFAAAIQHSMRVSLDGMAHSIRVSIDVLQGEPKEIPLI